MASGTTSISVTGIPITELQTEYERRGIGEWSDVRLVRAVADVVALPRRRAADSFVLHAPLELAARSALLPWVNGRAERELARLHVLAIAAQYEAFDQPIDEPIDEPRPVPLPPDADAGVWLLAAIAAGDLDDVDRASSALARSSNPRRLIRQLADGLLARTAAAAHAPIFLYQLPRVAPRFELPCELLRPLARELAREPGWRISWVDEWHPVTATDPVALEQALAATPRLGIPGSTFIHPTMMQVDAGTAREQLGDLLGAPDANAARAILRVAARSMLLDTPEHSPYGWSHCLTMPQAVLGISGSTADPARAFAIAATYVVAFRAALSSGSLALDPLDFGGRAEHPSRTAERIATCASISHDAHVVKYALACLDAAAWDPAAAGLYLAAAERLLDWWRDAGGDPTDPLRVG